MLLCDQSLRRITCFGHGVIGSQVDAGVRSRSGKRSIRANFPFLAKKRYFLRSGTNIVQTSDDLSELSCFGVLRAT